MTTAVPLLTGKTQPNKVRDIPQVSPSRLTFLLGGVKAELSSGGVPWIADTGHVPDPVLSEQAGAVSHGQQPAGTPGPVQSGKVRGVNMELDGVAGYQEVRVD